MNAKKDQSMKATGARGFVSRLCSILFIVILVVVILGAGTFLGAQILGYQPLAILSGSMEPNYNVGGLVMINTNVKADEIGVGDVITFELSEGTVVTHRVVAVNLKEKTFTTKGDANNTEDGAVSFDALVGKAGLHIPHLGAVAMGVHSKKGIAVGLLLLALLIILYVIPILLSPKQEKTDKSDISDGNDIPLEAAEGQEVC